MATAFKSNVTIQQDVSDELVSDPEVEASEIGVLVHIGVVKLSGIVDSYAVKMAAERASQRVAGVRAVVNDLCVRTPDTYNDTAIAKEAARALEANVQVPSGRIGLMVNNGNITLCGDVLWNYQRQAAFNSVRVLRGVRDVSNLITIRPNHVSADSVKDEIEQALVRSAVLDADRIQVVTHGSKVTLTGSIRTCAERDEAVIAAWRASGVTQVENQLLVTPQ